MMIGPGGETLDGGRTWHTVNGEIRRYPVKSGLRSLTDIFLFSNSFPGFTLRREVFEDVCYLNQDIFPLDDYDLALIAQLERLSGRRAWNYAEKVVSQILP